MKYLGCFTLKNISWKKLSIGMSRNRKIYMVSPRNLFLLYTFWRRKVFQNVSTHFNIYSSTNPTFFVGIMKYDKATAEAKIKYGMCFFSRPFLWNSFYLQILPFLSLRLGDVTINFDDITIFSDSLNLSVWNSLMLFF